VRPEERTARVKGWRMDCMLAVELRRHLGEEYVRLGEAWRYLKGYLEREVHECKELELPFRVPFASSFPRLPGASAKPSRKARKPNAADCFRHHLLKIYHIDIPAARESIHSTYCCCSWTVLQVNTLTPLHTIDRRRRQRSLKTTHPPSWRP
jgi:hypothetical protein